MVHEKNGTEFECSQVENKNMCVNALFFWCGSLTDCFLTLPLPHLLQCRETVKTAVTSCLEGIHLEKKDPLLSH